MDFSQQDADDWCSDQFQEQFVRDYFGTETKELIAPKTLTRVSDKRSNVREASDMLQVEETQPKGSNSNHTEKKKRKRSFCEKETDQSDYTSRSVQKMGIERKQIGKTAADNESSDLVKSRKRNGSKIKRKPSQLLKVWLSSKHHNSNEINCNDVDENTELIGKSSNQESITAVNSEERIGSKIKRKHSQFQKFFPYKRSKKSSHITSGDKKCDDTMSLEKSRLKKKSSVTTKKNSEKTDIEVYVVDDDNDDENMQTTRKITKCVSEHSSNKGKQVKKLKNSSNNSMRTDHEKFGNDITCLKESRLKNSVSSGTKELEDELEVCVIDDKDDHARKVEKHDDDEVECVAVYSGGKKRRKGFLNNLKNRQTTGSNIFEQNACKSDLQKTDSTKKSKRKSISPFEKTRLKNSISPDKRRLEDDIEVYEIDDDHDYRTEHENEEAECIAVHADRKGKETSVFKKRKRMKRGHCGDDNMHRQDKEKLKSPSSFRKTILEKKNSVSAKKRLLEGDAEVYDIDDDHDENQEDQEADCNAVHADERKQTGVFKKLKMIKSRQNNNDMHKLDKGKSISQETVESSVKCSGSNNTNLVQKKRTRRKKKRTRGSGALCANDNSGYSSQKSPERTCSLKSTACSRNEEAKAHTSEQEEESEDSGASDSMLVGHKAMKSRKQVNLAGISKSNRSTILKERMKMTLQPAKFRMLNEVLYNRTGEEAMKYFQSNRNAFTDYHQGYELQVSKWPVNPVDLIINDLKKLPKELIIADLGCGSAKIAQTFRNRKVYSYDLVAVNEYVKACDISKLPLQANSVNIVVFCLSLMGTNLSDYILEANRILKDGGTMKIAEVESRIDNINNFIKGIEAFGFSLSKKDVSCKMFVLLDFCKAKKKLKPGKPPKIVLSPCLYKKR